MKEPVYAKLPSGTVVRIDDIVIGRQMRAEEIPEGQASGFVMYGETGGPRIFGADPRDVEALAAYCDRIAHIELRADGPVVREP